MWLDGSGSRTHIPRDLRDWRREGGWPSKGVPNSILVPKPFAAAQLVTAVSSFLNIGTPPTS